MSIKRIKATKDNTISTAFKSNLNNRASISNMGASDILEAFSIYGHASSGSLERSRILVDFPVEDIYSMRTSGEIPASGSVSFKLKLFNAEHGQTTPAGYTMSAHPVVKPWSEGEGLDMESYLDKGTSNWYSASLNSPWARYGGDFATSSYIASSPISLNYDCVFDTGLENFETDITPLVEEWIKTKAGTNINASGSVTLLENPENAEQIKFYTYDSQVHDIIIATASVSLSNIHYVERGASKEDTLANIKTRLDSVLSTKISTTVTDSTISFTHTAGGFYGNSIISASFDASVGSVTNFAGGIGAINYGLLIKLSGSYETGDTGRSYYTKKYFARSSHHELKRPIIEIQWDDSIKDDRANTYKSSSLASADENLNNIYLYNKRRTGYMDIPNTGSALVVKLVPSLGSEREPITGPSVTDNYITASKHSTGIYKATFSYSGSQETLYDIWQRYDSGTGIYTDLFTGSAITVQNDLSYSYHEIPNYVVNITNLKPSYHWDEVGTFRVHTRDKNWKPNIYTVARHDAPVNIIQNAFYKISRVADNLTIINYSTSSTPSYSSLSYDSKGSYFDLDMSILEPNYLYEISFLYKDGTDYVEQKEKFKFRVDPKKPN